MRKSLFLIPFTLLLSVVMVSAGAAVVEDEQWPRPNEYAQGHHSVILDEQLQSAHSYSYLHGLYRGAERVTGEYICSSANDANCKDSVSYLYNAVLPTCSESLQLDCIESFSSISESGIVENAIFSEYVFKKHPNMFTGSPNIGIPNPGSASIWNLMGTPHPGGNQYGVVVGLSGKIFASNPTDNYQDLDMHLFAVSPHVGNGGNRDINGFANYAECIQRFNPNAYPGCAGGGQYDLGNFRCALQTDTSGDCYLQRPIPANFRFSLTIRLAKEPAGWMHGRMLNPVVSIQEIATGGVRVSIEAGSVKVPTFYYGSQYAQMPSALQDFWNTCMPSGTCAPQGSVWTRIANSNPASASGTERNVQLIPNSYGEAPINLIKVFAPFANDKSAAVPSNWNVRTLSAAEMSKANGCFATGPGIKGIVTTNSTSYSEGPPSFTDGSLNYKVASAHFNPDGTEFKGTYNLVMRSDVARCLYRFSAAPLEARISVVNESGENAVATTVVGEKAGWLSLAAYNFGFSSPQVKVQLTQAAEPTPTPSATAKTVAKKITITCIKGKVTKKVTAVNPKCPTGYKKKG